MRRSIIAGGLVLFGMACSSGRASDTDTRAAAAVARHESVVALLRAHPGLAFDVGASALVLDEQGFHGNGVRIPRRAIEPLSITASSHRIEVSARDVSDVLGAAEGDAVVYRDVAKDEDLVLALRDGSVEELRILRSTAAPTTFRWSIAVGEKLDARLREGRIEIFDNTGYAHLAADPIFAVDARGERRDLVVSIEATGDTRTITATLDAHDLAYPIVIDPLWSTVPNMRTVRYQGFFAVPLTDGRVFVAGGQAPYVDVYSPTTNTWSNGPDVPFTGPWTGMVGTRLDDGNVFALGSGTNAVRYNVSANTFTTLAAQPTACNGCAVVKLNDGRVLKVTSGNTVAEIYRPSLNSWINTGALPTSLTNPIAVLLNDGRVWALNMVTGQASYIYNPSTNTWASSLNSAPYRNNAGARAVALKNNKVMVVASLGGGSVQPQAAQLFDVATQTWSTTNLMGHIREYASLTMLPSGRVLAAGGQQGTTYWPDAEIYDPTYNAWQLIEAMPTPVGATSNKRSQHVQALLPGSSVLLAGGVTEYGAATNTATRYTAIADGQSCVGPTPAATCAAPYCTDGVCCNSAACIGGRCDVPGPGRAPGTCAKNNGQACTKGSDCISNFCVDGVCCSSACTGQCESCNLPGTPGTCAPVVGRPLGARPACGGAGAGTECTAVCNGSNRTACVYPTAGTIACGTDSCATNTTTGLGTETVSATCNGAGGCPTTTNACGAYACGASACKRSCAVEKDCAPGYYCSGDKCLPKVGLGSACTSSSMCPTGMFCTDGVCCGVATCGEGASCSAGATKGACAKLDGSTCGADGECASGFCTDGVCCNRRCDAQCEACDIPASKGTCSAVSGAPRGTRAACDDGASDKCKALECDGATDPTKCTKFKNGGTVVCQTGTCEGGNVVPQGTCDGAGACVVPVKSSCGKYACDPATISCRTDCRNNGDCNTGFFCVGGTCSETARCSDDRTQSIGTDGTPVDCAPFKCGTDGTCMKICSSTADCTAGNVCDQAAGKCAAAPTAETEDGGGCAAGSHAQSSGVAIAFLAMAVGVARASRRRARAT